jgi:signal transduction histidine kinase
MTIDSELISDVPGGPQVGDAAVGRRCHRRTRVALVGCGYVAAYVALDWVSYIYPVAPPLAITPWNPPPGLSLALLLRGGLRYAPWLYAAAIAAEIFVRHSPLPITVLLAACALPAMVYTALAVVLRGPLRLDAHFTRLRDAAIFLPAVAVASGLLACAFVGLFVATGLLPPTAFVESAAQFWVGDVIGIVVATPLLLVITRRSPGTLARSRLEEAAQFASILGTLWVVFASGWHEELNLFYLLFMPLVWIAMRHGVEGTAVASAVIQAGLIAALRLGGYDAAALLQYQALLLALAVTGLFLGLTVSERRAVERQLRDKQFELNRSLRLAAASEMASALAHELNQPLSAIGMYVRSCQRLLSEHPGAPPVLRSTMDKVVNEVARAGDVVRRLRDFFRSGSSQLARTAVAPLLDEAIAAEQPRADRHRVSCATDCAPALDDVLVDRIQIDTVLHNLLSNAIEAMKGTSSAQRRIVVRARRGEGSFVQITVADTGPGLSGDAAARLFHAFATSKPGGMGLGLAISRSIVEGHGGRLWLEPTERGCAFSFTLPVAPAS